MDFADVVNELELDEQSRRCHHFLLSDVLYHPHLLEVPPRTDLLKALSEAALTDVTHIGQLREEGEVALVEVGHVEATELEGVREKDRGGGQD